LRVGDAFVPELNTWGMAVTYATDIGASVINISGGGGLDNPKLARDAMDYAYDHGVTIIASNSDLDSFHHNFPNTSQHAISVHAIRYDSGTLGSATTFFNYNTCTNYGAQLMLSIPATGCSSEAAGRAGGLAGLLYSAAVQAGLPAVDKAGMRHLTAEEVRQLLIGTADNFYDPNDLRDPTKYPTAAPQPNGLAFARRFGYGRPNARSAVDAIFAGSLPPEVDIRSPGWFDTIYQDKTPSVTITTHFGWHGRALPTGTTMDWVIEWGRYDYERWKSGWQELFNTHRLAHNTREIKRIEISKEGDGAFAVVDIDTLWIGAGGLKNHWQGRVCKVYSKVGDQWKMTMQTGVLDYS